MVGVDSPNQVFSMKINVWFFQETGAVVHDYWNARNQFKIRYGTGLNILLGRKNFENACYKNMSARKKLCHL